MIRCKCGIYTDYGVYCKNCWTANSTKKKIKNSYVEDEEEKELNFELLKLDKNEDEDEES